MRDWNSGIIEEFRAKGGKGIRGFGDSLLLLHVRGRRSGTVRVYPLAYHRDGERYVVAGSKGGAPQHPEWYRNLLANPDVTVEVGTERFRARAIAIPRGPERDRLYAEHAKPMPGFLEYEKKTKRIIPVVVLERVAE
jgi:deazaflavin-dependent oxidoreductase (nitroreductase family)